MHKGVISDEILKLYDFNNFLHISQKSLTLQQHWQFLHMHNSFNENKWKGNEFLTWESEMDMHLDSTVGLRTMQGETCV